MHPLQHTSHTSQVLSILLSIYHKKTAQSHTWKLRGAHSNTSSFFLPASWWCPPLCIRPRTCFPLIRIPPKSIPCYTFDPIVHNKILRIIFWCAEIFFYTRPWETLLYTQNFFCGRDITLEKDIQCRLQGPIVFIYGATPPADNNNRPQ